ncbi:MAG: sensor histidine kinase [Chloroflexi bacterium]|nr:sensor histidine kinase [Chloroflexota bacterium]
MTTTGTSRYGPWRLSASTFDTILASLLTVGLVVEELGEFGRLAPGTALMTVPLLWRRTHPLPVFGVVVLGAVAGAGRAQYVGFFCIIVAAYSVGAYSRYRLLSLAIFLTTALAVDEVYGGVLPRLPDSAGPFLILFPFWLIGMAMGARQLRAELFEDRAARLEREQEQATQLALATERSRIARELHDVVAHSVSVMLVQAGAARHVLTSSPDEARDALLAVEASGREAMAELRNLLGLLNQDGAGVDLTPQPGMAQLDALVQRVRDAGLPVELRIEGAPITLPVGLDLTAYRIVQEALTNSLKYSALARTEVILEYRDGDLKLEILDDGPGGAAPADRGAGRGLVGMRERVAVYGGRLEAGPRLGRGYAVRAWLPLGGGPARPGSGEVGLASGATGAGRAR